MSKISKILVALTAGALSAALLVACGGGGYSAKDLVQGNMDVIYLDKADPTYCDAVNITPEEAHQQYLDGLATESTYFAQKYDINFDLAGEESYDKVIDLLDKIYANSRYEVGEMTTNGDIDVVTVTIYPINIYGDFESDSEAILEAWRNDYASGKFASDEEAEAAWVDAIVTGLSKYVDNPSYLDPQTIQVQVTRDDDGYRSISQNDWSRIDVLMLAY